MKVRSLDWSGRLKVEWMGEVVRDDDREIVLRCQFTRCDVETEYLHFRTDDTTIEHYPKDEWYNAFEVHASQGYLKGVYCNIAQPPTIEGDVLSYIDLTLDLFVYPDGRWLALDEEDFEARARDEYPPEVVVRARQALEHLVELVKREGSGSSLRWKSLTGLQAQTEPYQQASHLPRPDRGPGRDWVPRLSIGQRHDRSLPHRSPTRDGTGYSPARASARGPGAMPAARLAASLARRRLGHGHHIPRRAEQRAAQDGQTQLRQRELALADWN